MGFKFSLIYASNKREISNFLSRHPICASRGVFCIVSAEVSRWDKIVLYITKIVHENNNGAMLWWHRKGKGTVARFDSLFSLRRSSKWDLANAIPSYCAALQDVFYAVTYYSV